jgi:hypothetical protein
MVWKQIILEGGFPQWVDVPETSTEEAGRMIREGYSKGPSAILKSKFTGWDKKGALWRR